MVIGYERDASVVMNMAITWMQIRICLILIDADSGNMPCSCCLMTSNVQV
jgi:hypothetical protein